MLRRWRTRTGVVATLLALSGFAWLPPPDSGAQHPKVDGDPLPDGALARFGTLRWRHAMAVNFVSVISDNEILTGSRDHVIRLLDRQTGKEIRRFDSSSIHKPFRPRLSRHYRGLDYDDLGISSVDVTADGKTLAAALPNNVVQIWDVKTGKEIRQLKRTEGIVQTIRFSPSGTVLAIRHSMQNVDFYHLDTGTVKQFKNDPKDGMVSPGCYAGMAFSPDGKIFANGRMGSDQVNLNTFVQLLDAKTGVEIRRFDTAMKNPASIAFAEGGKQFAFAAGDRIHLHEVASGKEIRQIKTPAPVTAVIFFDGGKKILSKALDQQIRVWDCEKGQILQEWGDKAPFPSTLRERASEARDLALSADGASCAWGDGQTVRLADPRSGKDLAPPVGHRGAVTAMAVTPDSRTVLSYGEDNSVRRWDLLSGKQLDERLAPPGTTLAVIAPDARTAALADSNGNIRLMDLATGKQRFEVKGHPRLNPDSANETADLAFSPDGKLLASQGSFDNTIRLFNTAQGTELRQILIEPVGKPDPAIGGIFYRFLVDGGQGLAFSADGQIVGVHVKEMPSRDFFPSRSQLRQWNVATGKELPVITLPKSCFATQIAYSPDGRLLAVLNEDQTIGIYETASGQERVVLGKAQVPQVSTAWIHHRRRDPAPVRTLSFAPDGTRLLACAPMDIVRVWDLHAGQELGKLQGHAGPVLTASFTPDGRFIVTGGNDTTVLLWDAKHLKRRPIAERTLDAKEVESLWADLLDGDAARAFASIQNLAAAPKQSIPFLRQQIKPIPRSDGKRVERFIADLDSTNFRARMQAARELEGMGELALPDLKTAHALAPSLETRRRIESLLEKVTPGALVAEQIRLVRSMEVLERAGTVEAKKLLHALADGAPGALTTRQAKSALSRLQQQSGQ